MLAVVTFAFQGSRPIYTPWTAENCRRMYARHLTVPHRFVVVTDEPERYEAEGFEVHPLWVTPQRPARMLNNYCRLGVFDEELGGRIAPRILCTDQDLIIRRNIDDVVATDAPLKILAMRGRPHVQSGFMLVTPGAVEPNPWRALWDKDVLERAALEVGSDQAVCSTLFYQRVKSGEIPHWSEADGFAINSLRGDWRAFFRTGMPKPWERVAPEYVDYMRACDREPVGMPHRPALRRLRRIKAC